MAGKLKIFLSHNSADKPAVEALALRLRQEGDVEPWLDKWNLIPGAPWQEELERAIVGCDVCLICIGPNGLGAWHHEEMRALINRRVSDRQQQFRVIPVLLPGAERGSRSSLPTFLVATTWVEFRRTLDDADAFQRLLCGIRGEKPGPPPDGRAALAECPYRGLEFFDVAHADRFFGREAVTQWLVDDIRKPLRPGSEVPRFLAILGASGSGKSSLARAGLYAALRGGAIEGSRDWLFVPPLRPGPNPLESLELAVLHAAAGSPQLEAVRHELRELADKPDRLHRAARLLVPDASPPRRLFLLVDQFEEVFTTSEKEELRRPFIAALLHAARERGGPVVVALTMRADFYPKVAAYEELARVVDQHQYLVGPMSEAELRLAIETPAVRAGAEFEPGLVDTLLENVHRQPGALPLLQHALLELWNIREDGRRLTHNAYKTIRGLEGALERRANEVFCRFSAEDQELCRRIFLRLVHLGEGAEDTKRRVQLRELLALGDATQILKLIATLAAPDSRLVVTKGGSKEHPDQAFVEVAHETLIRSWSQLRKWLDADRAGLRTQRRLTEATQEWNDKERKPDFLYGGGWLAIAQEWAKGHGAELSKPEKEFLKASVLHGTWKGRTLKAFVLIFTLVAITSILTRHEKASLEQEKQQLQAALFATEQSVADKSTDYDRLFVRTLLHLPRATSLARTIDPRKFMRLSRSTNACLKGHSAPVLRAAFNFDGRRLATAGGDSCVVVWSVVKGLGTGQAMLQHPGIATGITFDPTAKQIAVGCSDGVIRLLDCGRITPSMHSWPDDAAELRGHLGAVTGLAFAQDGAILAAGSTDGTVSFWDVMARRRLPTSAAETHTSAAITSTAFSKLGRFACADEAGMIQLWEVGEEPRLIGAQQCHKGEIACLAFSPDGSVLASAGTDRFVRIWEHKSGLQLQTVITNLKSEPLSIAFSPSGQDLAIGRSDGTLALWSLETQQFTTDSLLMHSSSVAAVCFSPDKSAMILASAGFDNVVWLLHYDHATGIRSAPPDAAAMQR